MDTIEITHTIRIRDHRVIHIQGEWDLSARDFTDPPDVQLRRGTQGLADLDWPDAAFIMSLAWGIDEKRAEARMLEGCAAEAEELADAARMSDDAA